MSKCKTCGGGYDPRFLDKPCPECGFMFNAQKKPKSVVSTETSAESPLCIPRHYKDKVWSKSVLLDDKRNDVNQNDLHKYANLLETIHNSFMKGKLPPRSAIIIAPPRYSKVTWAYSCMQVAEEKGLTVAPLLDTIELKRFLLLAPERPFHKIYKMMDYEEYVTADVCFITVTKSYKYQEAFSIILELLDIRSRKGLPTYIISRFSLNQLSGWDSNNHFLAIREDYYNEDPYKFPTICRYSSI